jgi:hypothetical protein
VVRRGSTVTIRYIGAGGPAKRIGIVPARGGRPIASLPIADTSDHRAAFFGTAGLRPGAYRAALLGHGRRACLLALLGARRGRGYALLARTSFRVKR